MAAHVHKGSGYFPRGRRIAMVRQAQSDVVIVKQIQNRRFEPAGMPEFKCITPARFKQSNKPKDRDGNWSSMGPTFGSRTLRRLSINARLDASCFPVVSSA